MIHERTQPIQCPNCKKVQLYTPRTTNESRKRKKCTCGYMIEVSHLTKIPHEKFEELSRLQTELIADENKLRELLEHQSTICINDIVAWGFSYDKARRFLLKCVKRAIIKEAFRRKKIVYYEHDPNGICINDDPLALRLHGNFQIKFPIQSKPSNFHTNEFYDVKGWRCYIHRFPEWKVRITTQNLIFTNNNLLFFDSYPERDKYEREIPDKLFQNEVQHFVNLGFVVLPGKPKNFHLADNIVQSEKSINNTHYFIDRNGMEVTCDCSLGKNVRECDFDGLDARDLFNAAMNYPVQRTQIENLSNQNQMLKIENAELREQFKESQSENMQNLIVLSQQIAQQNENQKDLFEHIKIQDNIIQTLSNRNNWGAFTR